MKAILRTWLLIFAVIAWQACDKVSAPYKEVVIHDTGARKVLVEDYTGAKCGNCPRASKEIYNLKAVYGDNLIIMAIHAGGFAEPYPYGMLPANPTFFATDFRTPEGTNLDTDFGISGAGKSKWNGKPQDRRKQSYHISYRMGF